MREIRFIEPYLFTSGSKNAGKKWKDVALKLNKLQTFQSAPRDSRSVRERYQRLTENFKAKTTEEIKASGISPEPTETDTIIEEIQEKLKKC